MCDIYEYPIEERHWVLFGFETITQDDGAASNPPGRTELGARQHPADVGMELIDSLSVEDPQGATAEAPIDSN